MLHNCCWGTMKATHCIELSTSHCNPASRPCHGERTHLFPAYHHVSMSWDFSGLTNMVCLSSQNVRKSDLEESYNISILVLCQIPGLRNQVLILQPLATNTVAALVPFPSKRSDLRRLCQGSHPFQDIDGFSGQSDCFSALQNLTRSRQSSSPRDVPPIKYTQPSRTAAAHLISINFYRPAFKHTNQQAQCKSL